MSTAKKKVPPQMGLRALKAHNKALAECFGRAKADLREAKKELAHRAAQMKAAQEHAAAVTEVMATMCRTVLRVRDCMPMGLVDDTGWPELVAVAEEWNPE